MKKVQKYIPPNDSDASYFSYEDWTAMMELRREVELRMKWGPIRKWGKEDFLTLAQLLPGITQPLKEAENLSAILGKKKIKMPNQYHESLHALSQWLGYESWDHFKSVHYDGNAIRFSSKGYTMAAMQHPGIIGFLIGLVVLAAIICLLIIF